MTNPESGPNPFPKHPEDIDAALGELMKEFEVHRWSHYSPIEIDSTTSEMISMGHLGEAAERLLGPCDPRDLAEGSPSRTRDGEESGES